MPDCHLYCPTAVLVLLQSLNYAPIAVGIVLAVSLGWWVCGARKWFTGPRRTLDEAEDPVDLQADLQTGMKGGKDPATADGFTAAK